MSDVADQFERIRAISGDKLEELLASGGKKSIRHRCSACAHYDTFDINIEDYDLIVKMLPAITNALKTMREDKDQTGSEALKLQQDTSEMSTADLAEYIVRLRQRRDEILSDSSRSGAVERLVRSRSPSTEGEPAPRAGDPEGRTRRPLLSKERDAEPDA